MRLLQLVPLQPPQLPLLALVLLCSFVQLKQQGKVVAHEALPAQGVPPVGQTLELVEGKADAVTLGCTA